MAAIAQAAHIPGKSVEPYLEYGARYRRFMLGVFCRILQSALDNTGLGIMRPAGDFLEAADFVQLRLASSQKNPADAGRWPVVQLAGLAIRSAGALATKKSGHASDGVMKIVISAVTSVRTIQTLYISALSTPQSKHCRCVRPWSPFLVWAGERALTLEGSMTYDSQSFN
jgi:hypothetical protein